MGFFADLHIHSCLSPCGDLNMSPKRIAERAARLGLSLVALTDHNTALNCPAFAETCKKEGIAAVYGIEVTTVEEIHVLALFESVEQALALGEIVSQHMPKVAFDPARHGDQVYVNEDDEILGEVSSYLGVGTFFSLESLLETVNKLEGLFIPAHIDRPCNSLFSQLGRIPDLPFSGLEVTRFPSKMPTSTHVLVSNSDAHMLELVGMRYTIVEGHRPSFKNLCKALQEGQTELSLVAIDVK